MSIYAATPIEAIRGQIGPLGRDQNAIKIYFNALGEVGNAGLQPGYSGTAGAVTNEETWSQDEIDTVLQALAGIEALIDVQFEVTTDKALADLDFVKNDNADGVTGYVAHYLEDEGGQTHRESTVVINHTLSSLLLWRSPWSGGYEIGTYGYQVLLSMLGGALGLTTPHNAGNGSKILEGLSPDDPFSFGPDLLNDTINSVMNKGIGWDYYDTVNFNSGARGTMGAWDIEALQQIYGAKAGTNAGDTVYILTDNFVTEPSYFKTIYDTGGNDWIEAGSIFFPGTTVFGDIQIDLRPATLDYDTTLSGGGKSFAIGTGGSVGQDGFTIAQGSIIENAKGGFGDDTLIGNDVGNILIGQEGDDLFLPGLGVDSMDGGLGQDEYAGTVAELTGDTIENINGNDRVFVYGVSYTDAQVSVILDQGVTKLVADTGQPGERLEMILGTGIGLQPSEYRLFTSPRGADTIITFAQTDVHGNTLGTGTPFEAEGISSFSDSDGLLYGILEEAGDIDFFDNYDTEYENILLEVLGASANGGTLLNPVIEVYDASDGSLVFLDNGTGPGGAARVIIPAEDDGNFLTGPVDYRISVRGQNGETGTYTLRGIKADDIVNTLPASGFLILDDTFELPHGLEVEAEIETAGDIDMIRFETAPETTYILDLIGLPNRFGAKVDTYVEVYDLEGNLYATTDGGGVGTDARLSFTTPATDPNALISEQTQTFYFAISATPGAAASGATGKYSMKVTAIDDYADSPIEAQTIATDGSTVSGKVEHGTDKDFFRIWMVAGEGYTFDIDPISSLTLSLWDPGVRLIADYDIDFSGSEYTFTAGETGYHYLSTATNFGSGVNGYALLVTGGPLLPTPTQGADVLVGTNSGDMLYALAGDDSVEGLSGDDTLLGGAGQDTISGGNGADTLFGKTGDDLLDGDAGDDRAFGGDGADTINGGDGNDSLSGNGDADLISGGLGDDTLVGGLNADTLNGDEGADELRGEGGDDVLAGGNGADRLFGASGEDSLTGGNGDDLLDGGTQNDHLLGEAGADTLRGGDGYDTLHGGAGDDELYGGNGLDRLDGGMGQDTLRGDAGGDTFVFSSVDASAFGAADFVNGVDGIGVANGDVFDLSGIDANETLAGDQAFTFLGEVTTSVGLAAGAGVLWVKNNGTNTQIFGSTDGDMTIDFAINVGDAGVQAADYRDTDFIL